MILIGGIVPPKNTERRFERNRSLSGVEACPFDPLKTLCHPYGQCVCICNYRYIFKANFPVYISVDWELNSKDKGKE